MFYDHKPAGIREQIVFEDLESGDRFVFGTEVGPSSGVCVKTGSIGYFGLKYCRVGELIGKPTETEVVKVEILTLDVTTKEV